MSKKNEPSLRVYVTDEHLAAVLRYWRYVWRTDRDAHPDAIKRHKQLRRAAKLLVEFFEE